MNSKFWQSVSHNVQSYDQILVQHILITQVCKDIVVIKKKKVHNSKQTKFTATDVPNM